MIAREIVDFLGSVMDIVFNDFVFFYLILPFILAYGLIRSYKKDNQPYLKPVMSILAIYYVLRTIIILLF